MHSRPLLGAIPPCLPGFSKANPTPGSALSDTPLWSDRQTPACTPPVLTDHILPALIAHLCAAEGHCVAAGPTLCCHPEHSRCSQGLPDPLYYPFQGPEPSFCCPNSERRHHRGGVDLSEGYRSWEVIRPFQGAGGTKQGPGPATAGAARPAFGTIEPACLSQ